MSSITWLAERLNAIRFEALDERAVEAARQRLFDTLASFAVGTTTGEGHLLLRFAETSPFPATMNLIRYMCGTIRHTEVDDIHIGSCTTAGSMVVPVAVLTAAAEGIDDQQALCSLVAGYEAMTRLGSAVDGALRIYEGVWGTYLAAPFAGAAVVAKLRGYVPEQMSHALAIAASRSTGIAFQMPGHETARWFTAGSAAVDGYLCAQAAQVGMKGDVEILEKGFARAIRAEFKPDLFQEGTDWRILDIDSKPFRTSRQGLSATEACLDLMNGQCSDDVEEAQVWLPKQVLALVDQPNPPAERPSIGLQHQLAAAIVDSATLYDPGGVRPPDEGRVRPLMGRIGLSDDPKLTSLYPRQWGGRVEITWRNGQRTEAEVLDPNGSARKLFGWDELLAKHRRLSPDAPWLDRALDVCRQFGGTPGARTSGELLRSLPELAPKLAQ
jgi:2-methylcitrate dehydratase PrpD